MYVGNLHQLRGVLDRTIKYDMRDPFRIPSMIDTINDDASLIWGDSTTSLDMLQHWSQITLDETNALQRDTNLFALEEDMASSDWMKYLLVNSSEASLTQRVDEKYQVLDYLERG